MLSRGKNAHFSEQNYQNVWGGAQQNPLQVGMETPVLPITIPEKFQPLPNL